MIEWIGDGEMEEFETSITQETSRDGDVEDYTNSSGNKF